jgi:hypothetical protein
MTIGQFVACPPDRGGSGYNGRIRSIDDAVQVNIHGVKFKWVTVEEGRYGQKTSSVWPSHRLGFRIG